MKDLEQKKRQNESLIPSSTENGKSESLHIANTQKQGESNKCLLVKRCWLHHASSPPSINNRSEKKSYFPTHTDTQFDVLIFMD